MKDRDKNIGYSSTLGADLCRPVLPHEVFKRTSPKRPSAEDRIAEYEEIAETVGITVEHTGEVSFTVLADNLSGPNTKTEDSSYPLEVLAANSQLLGELV